MKKKYGSISLLAVLLIILCTTFVYTDNLVEPNVGNFPDPALESAVRKALNKPYGIITAADLRSLTVLRAPGQEGARISNLEGLQYCHYLEELYLENNTISSLNSIINLENLRILVVGNNKLVYIDQISNLSSLSKLTLDHNPLLKKNISDLGGLTNLENLSLIGLGLTDISTAAQFTRLVSLYVSDNKISNINPLKALTNLKYLDLSNNPIGTVTVLRVLNKLVFLDVHNCELPHIAPINTLRNLTYLDISDNYIEDLTPCKYMTKVNRFKAGNNNISDISTLFYMPNLQVAHLDYNSISDIGALATALNLLELKLNNNKLQTADVLSPLRYQDSLMYLDVNYNNMNISSGTLNLTVLQALDQKGAKVYYQEGNLSGYTPPVSFTDPALERAVRNSLNLSANEALTLNKLKNLKALYGDDSRIESLEGISLCTNLEEIYLSYNQIKDITPLNDILSTIKILDVTYNNMDISLKTGTTTGKENQKLIYKLVTYYNATVYCAEGNIFP